MKYGFLFVFLVWGQVQAQSQRLFFLDNGFETPTIDKAEYYRDMTKLNDTSYHYVQFTKAGVRTEEGTIRSLNPDVLNGNHISYYPNQQKREEGFYRNNQQEGIWEFYYQNGQLKDRGNYVKPDNEFSGGPKFKLEFHQDSLGNVQVQNGSGNYTSYHINGEIDEKGRYENGEKIGVWTGYLKNKSKSYEESYIDGNLNSGISFDSLSNSYSYKNLIDTAVFEGGNKAMYLFIGNNVRYPQMAQMQNLQGIVYVSFIIDTKGRVYGIEVLKSPDASFSVEARRVIRRMNGKWIPGKERGQAVKSKFVLPISFLLE